jgi:hypothetical protein
MFHLCSVPKCKVKLALRVIKEKMKQLTLSLLSLRLLFRLFRVAGGGLGGGPLGSLGGPDLSRCRLKPLLGGRGDRLLERFLGTENDRDLKYTKSQLKLKTKQTNQSGRPQNMLTNNL